MLMKQSESSQMPIRNQRICGLIIQRWFAQSLIGETAHLGKPFRRFLRVENQ
nr:putative LOV domain-containing protein [Ipomoea batatas]